MVVEAGPLVVVEPAEAKVVWRSNEEEEKDEVVLRHGFDLTSEYPTRTISHCFPVCVRVFVLRYVKNQECISCSVRSGVDEETHFPFLICDVFKLDLAPGNGNGCRRLGSYKYFIKQDFYDISVEGLVPLSKAIESQKRLKLAHGEKDGNSNVI